MKTFSDFQFPQAIGEALEAMGYETPTPVQSQAIPLVLENRDVLATAQTGTGKTAAFALPLIAKMLGGDMRPALIVAPTRELAEQIGAVLEQLTTYCPQIKSAVVIGGTAYPRQIRQLRSNPMFVVGTPGRLLDQVRLGHLKLEGFSALVIDEADRLLDMGFEPQMNALVASLPAQRQSLLFSATLPDEIIRLANKYLRQPVRVSIGAVSKPIDKIKQDVINTNSNSKDQTLVRELDKVSGSILIFTKTKWKTEKLAKFLDGVGHEVGRIHGDRSQTQRSSAIRDFREGKIRILVATDIAARGLDIPHIEHVINYDLPMSPEDYIHRIGRTARAGAEGHSIAFVTPEETLLWARIHKLMYGKFPDQGYNRPGSYGGQNKHGSSKGPRAASSGGQPKFTSGPGSAGPKGNRETRRAGLRPSQPRGTSRFRPGDESTPALRGPRHSRYNDAPGPVARGPKPERIRPISLSPRQEAEEMAKRFLEEERRKANPRPQNAQPKKSGQVSQVGARKPGANRTEISPRQDPERKASFGPRPSGPRKPERHPRR